jgi:hypothetical protein
MHITLKVSKHTGTGKLTLTEKREGERIAEDVRADGLGHNDDPATFYRATARYLHTLHREGHNVTYEDVAY